MNKLIQKYNHKDSLIMISLYPKKGEFYSAGTTGVASYAKNIAKNMNHKVIILSDYKNCPKIYEEEDVLVYRCFKNKTPLMWIQLLKSLSQFREVKHILLQLDFGMYGKIITTSLVMPFLAILKIFGYKPNVVMHHVISDACKLKGHVGLDDHLLGTLKGKIYNLVFHFFYCLLGLVSNKVIVLEEALKDKLEGLIDSEKILAIPHGVDTQLNPVSKFKARQLLGLPQTEYIILFFGFVNWFKGADFFVSAYSKTRKLLRKKTRFIIAGGESPTMKDKPFYHKYFNEVKEKITESENIYITGYVPQEQIGLYFSACDLVVLPYRHFMTASGVLSLVFSYKKPFIVSSELSEMMNESDIKQAFEASDLTKDKITFQLNKKSCLNATKRVLQNGLKIKSRNVAQILRTERSYKNTALLYESMLFGAFAKVGKTHIEGLPAFGYTQRYES